VDQYLALEPDVLLGGGSDYFLPTGTPGGKRKDGKDLIAAFPAKGYQVARNSQALRTAIGPRLLGLFAEEDMDHEIDRDAAKEPSIAEMTEAALRVLSQDNRTGFVLLLETENTDTASHRNDIAALIRDLWIFDRAVALALECFRKAPGETLLIVTGDHDTGGLSPTHALKDLNSPASGNRFYAGPAHLEMINRITISLEKAAEALGKKPSAEALDKLVAAHFPGFRLDPDLREAILKQQVLERNFTYPTQNALARMVSRQTGFYWRSAGHTAQPVVVGALGPGAELFKGYLDNTDFGKILHRLIDGR
jgi:alkaline phosphatase